MALYAHPADPITDCGGTLALHAENGDDVVALVITHGGRMHPNYFAEEWRKENPNQDIVNASPEYFINFKLKEAERAAEILGISKMINLKYEDNMVGVSEEVVDKIAEVLIAEKPDILIMDYPHNAALPDPHTIASITAMNAVVKAGMYNQNLDGKSEFHIKQIFFTKIPVTARNAMTLNGIRNDVFIDITSVVGKKIKAMDQYVSQGYHADFARKFVESHDGDRGRAAGVNFAEAFCRKENETHLLLPLTDYAAKRDVLTTHRKYSTISIREMFPY